MYFISKWNSLVTVRIELALEPFQLVPEEGKALAYLERPLSAFLRGVQQRANVASRHVEVHGHAGQRLPGALQLLRDRVDLSLLSSKLPRKPFLDRSHLGSKLGSGAGH